MLWLLFPLAAAMNFSYLYIQSPNGENTMEKITSRGRNTMPLKDGEAPKLHRKMPNVTSETHRN